MRRLGDFFLITIFAVLLIGTVTTFIVSRFGFGDWGKGNGKLTAFELITEEQKAISELNVLKSNYAQSIVDYQSKLKEIDASVELTDVEKAERRGLLNKYYSKDFFNQQTILMDQKQSLIDQLEKQKCQFTCSDSAS